MADTGWLRWTNIQDNDGGWDNDLALVGTGSGTVTNTGDALGSLIFEAPGTGWGNDLINPMARVTGIELKIKAKIDEVGGATMKNQIRLRSFVLTEVSASVPQSSEFAEYTWGGENIFFDSSIDPIYFTPGNLANISLLHRWANKTSGTTVSLLGDSESPAIKIYYEPFTKSVTEWKRFKTLVTSSTTFFGDLEDIFPSGSNDNSQVLFNVTGDPPSWILADPESFDEIPDNNIIHGIQVRTVIQPAAVLNASGDQPWKLKVAASPFDDLNEITDHYYTISGSTPLSWKQNVQDIIAGGETNLLGSTTLTPSDLPDLRFGTKCTQNPRPYIAVYGGPGSGSGNNIQVRTAAVLPSPAIRVFYGPPPPSQVKFKSGPNFISSTVDLTSFRGLGDRTSPLQSPPSSEDLFGFTSTIVPEGDNSSQATDSVFGDAANFGKLGLNRGGGTGISSDTGLLDTSKAPLSVRKGFRGL